MNTPITLSISTEPIHGFRVDEHGNLWFPSSTDGKRVYIETFFIAGGAVCVRGTKTDNK